VQEIDVAYCFYDDPDYASDADRDSRVLKEWHRQLWSKQLPSGEHLEWIVESGSYLTCTSPRGPVRVSSDTIATTHSGYTRSGATQLWIDLGQAEQSRYERAFYTIGGFIIFPTRPQSLNQLRGTDRRIADRFDLTLECIRQHYLGEHENPLAAVLQADAGYFRLFGQGRAGFAAYVDFFHLHDLMSEDSITWMDDSTGQTWDFDTPPLPTSASAYRRYLDNVLAFVSARNGRIREWCDARTSD
jgi:hypothetical protein